jgi:hypothetical protein
MIRLMRRDVGFGRERSMLLRGMCLLAFKTDIVGGVEAFPGRFLQRREAFSGGSHEINGKGAGVVEAKGPRR